jgi:hypothetical protein
MKEKVILVYAIRDLSSITSPIKKECWASGKLPYPVFWDIDPYNSAWLKSSLPDCDQYG